jgi:hypothetical protein
MTIGITLHPGGSVSAGVGYFLSDKYLGAVDLGWRAFKCLFGVAKDGFSGGGFFLFLIVVNLRGDGGRGSVGRWLGFRTDGQGRLEKKEQEREKKGVSVWSGGHRKWGCFLRIVQSSTKEYEKKAAQS